MEEIMRKPNLFISNSDASARGVPSRRRMLLWLCRLSVVLGLLLVSLFGIIMPQYSYAYTGALQDKMERLMAVQEPKIVLIGDSNLAFGMDSEMLEKAMGMPVVNMGLHGSLGNAFQEQMAKVHVTEGDIVIVAHTFFGDEDRIADPVVAWITLENHKTLWQLVRPKDYADLFYAYPDYARKAIDLWKNKEGTEPDYGDYYNRMAFNAYGDVALERTEQKYTFTENSVTVPAISNVCIRRLNELYAYLEERGAVMLVAAYPIADGEYTPEPEAYREFQAELEEKLDCEVISEYTDYFYEYRLFFDTNYHLTTEGAKLRTGQLIEDLQRWQQKQN